MADVTVLIPTVGRVGHLEQCFAALGRCTRRPDSVLVVAQGAHADVVALAAAFPELPLRVVRDDGRGRGRALNVGLRNIHGGVVLVTDDDCRVRADWVERGLSEVLSRADTLVTGRVLTRGDPTHVPALRLDPIARDYVGHAGFGRLSGGNMAARLADLNAIGGFDERIWPTAEDNDLCWRWLRSGKVVHYEPEMVIWHDDWRDDDELRAVFRGYGQGQGAFYAKHLALGDPQIAAFVAREVVAGSRLVVGTLARGRSLRSEPYLTFFPALARALAGRPWMRDACKSALASDRHAWWRQAGSVVRARGISVPPAVADRSVTGAQEVTAVPSGLDSPPTNESDRLPVIITTRNRRPHVCAAVASVLAQTVPTKVIVIDDGSSDGTREALLHRFPGISVEFLGRPIGHIAQRNRAMRLTDAEFVVMMDDDAYLPSPRTLEQALSEFDHPRTAVVTIPYVNARRERFLRLAAPGDAGAYVAGVFVGVGAMFRRSAFCQAGGYESDLGSHGEEGDLALRLLASGFVVRMSRADPLVHWEVSPIKTNAVHFNTARNEVLLTALRVPAKYLPLRLAVVVVHGLLRGIAKRRPCVIARGLIAGGMAAWTRRDERRPVPVWAYELARTLRRRGPCPMDEVVDRLSLHTAAP